MKFRDNPEVLQVQAEAGCGVEGEQVRFTLGFCGKTIQATASARFTQHTRNPTNDVQIGGDATVLCP